MTTTFKEAHLVTSLVGVAVTYMEYCYSSDTEYSIGQLMEVAEHCYKLFRSEDTEPDWHDREIIFRATQLLIAKFHRLEANDDA